MYHCDALFVIALQTVDFFLAQVIVFGASEYFLIWIKHSMCVLERCPYLERKKEMLLPSFFPVGMDEEDDQSATLDQALNDTTRVGYFKGYLASVAQAIK